MRDDLGGGESSGVCEQRYEPPAVFDLGGVHEVTLGNGDGAADKTGQQVP